MNNEIFLTPILGICVFLFLTSFDIEEDLKEIKNKQNPCQEFNLGTVKHQKINRFDGTVIIQCEETDHG